MSSVSGTVSGAVSTAVSALLERPATGRVVHLGAVVGVELSTARGARLVVLDAAPGPGTLPCSLLVPRLPPAVLGQPVLVDAAELRATGWAVRVDRWWQPARVRTAAAPVWMPGRAGTGLPAAVDGGLHSAGAALRARDVG